MNREYALPDNLCKVMKEKKISLRALSRATNLTVATITHYRHGDRIPNVIVTQIIADEIGISLDELVWKKVQK